MARGGIYKAEVKRARDRLLALGRHPSIDAVRIELGNTGSKGTIHRYLKEIDEEEGKSSGSKVGLSEALQDFIAKLAGQLQDEADAKIEELAARHSKEIEEYRKAQGQFQALVDDLKQSLQQRQVELEEEQSTHKLTSEQLREETLARALAVQQAADLQDRLQVEERHRHSLEENHEHARLALEHFRVSAKEQREQEHRQHEQQVHYLQGEVRTLSQAIAQKQQEAIQSNQENARLMGELTKAETRLHDATIELRELKGLKEELVSAQRQKEILERRVVELKTEVGALLESNAGMESKIALDSTLIQQLKIDLASVKTASETQDQLAEKIQTWIAQLPANSKTKLRQLKPAHDG